MYTSLHTLRSIWERSEGTFVFLASRIGAKFEQLPYAPSTIQDTPDSRKADLFFTPLRFNGRQRLNVNVYRPGVLFADLDGSPEITPELEPSVRWETSPGNSQAVWFLDQPQERSEWEEVNRALTYYVGADRGGWHAAKLLRVPFTLNHKYDPPVSGKALYYTGKVYTLAQVWLRVGGALPSAPPVHMTVGNAEEPKLPLSIAFLLQKTRVPDRSLHLYQLARELRRIGMSAQATFNLLENCPANKFRNRPNDLRKYIIKPVFGNTETSANVV